MHRTPSHPTINATQQQPWLGSREDDVQRRAGFRLFLLRGTTVLLPALTRMAVTLLLRINRCTHTGRRLTQAPQHRSEGKVSSGEPTRGGGGLCHQRPMRGVRRPSFSGCAIGRFRSPRLRHLCFCIFEMAFLCFVLCCCWICLCYFVFLPSDFKWMYVFFPIALFLFLVVLVSTLSFIILELLWIFGFQNVLDYILTSDSEEI